MKAQFKIIMRKGYFIPQERFLKFFWKDMPPLPVPYKEDDPNRTVMYSQEQAQEFIAATLAHRKKREYNKAIENAQIESYLDSEGQYIGGA